MSRINCFILAFALILAAPLASAQQKQQGQQEGRFQFGVGIEAVNLDVVVTDRHGRFVPGLEAADFEILEDGVAQELSFFTSEITPLTVLLLLDASTSIRPSGECIK